MMIDQPRTTSLSDLWAQPIDDRYLLDDQQVLNFIACGYHWIDSIIPAEINRVIDAKATALPSNPGDAILDEIPEFHQVYTHPVVRAALVSLLGRDMRMNSHRHCHTRRGTPFAHQWHTDGGGARGSVDLQWVLGIYYPHDVPVEMGPTVILPGSHFRNALNPTMMAYGNIRGQLPLTAKAGTVVIVHPNIWHGVGPNYTDKARHMVKFLFDRKSVPQSPAWNHDENLDQATIDGILGKQITHIPREDHTRQTTKRHEMWAFLSGQHLVTART